MKAQRSTTAKKEIREIIGRSAVALSHTEIQLVTKDLCDRVTIYRVLERLVEEGSVHRIVNTDGVVKYAACHDCGEQHHHSHAHFSCVVCKAVTCLEHVIPEFKLPKGYKLQEMNFTLSGVCPLCS